MIVSEQEASHSRLKWVLAGQPFRSTLALEIRWSSEFTAASPPAIDTTGQVRHEIPGPGKLYVVPEARIERILVDGAVMHMIYHADHDAARTFTAVTRLDGAEVEIRGESSRSAPRKLERLVRVVSTFRQGMSTATWPRRPSTLTEIAFDILSRTPEADGQPEPANLDREQLSPVECSSQAAFASARKMRDRLAAGAIVIHGTPPQTVRIGRTLLDLQTQDQFAELPAQASRLPIQLTDDRAWCVFQRTGRTENGVPQLEAFHFETQASLALADPFSAEEKVRQAVWLAVGRQEVLLVCDHADGRSLSTFDLTIRQWCPAVDLPRAGEGTGKFGAAVSNDRKLLTLADDDGVCMVSLPELQLVTSQPGELYAGDVTCFSPDDSEVVGCDFRGITIWGRDGKILRRERFRGIQRVDDRQIDWLPDGSGFLLGGTTLFDRQSLAPLLEMDYAVGQRLLHQNHLFVLRDHGAFRDLSATSIPWDLIRQRMETKPASPRRRRAPLKLKL